jgi:hypothetical protein
MHRVRELLKNNPHFAISIPTILCFVQFVYEIIEIVKTGKFDSTMLNQLISSANGFEAVCLFVIMLVLKDKKK